MNKRLTSLILIVLLLVFTGFLILDFLNGRKMSLPDSLQKDSLAISDQWSVVKVFEPGRGRLNAVALTENGSILLAGESFIAFYSSDFQVLKFIQTAVPVTAITNSGNFVYAAEGKSIVVYDIIGEKVEEWGPFEDDAIITSLASNDDYVAFADAANRSVYILHKDGTVASLIGKSGEPFVIPSNFFDIALGSGNILYAANTGNRRIESRNLEGIVTGTFGKSGTGPDGFCGCCNPAHFCIIPGGFVTAEKGINRIKILDENGEFRESVSSENDFKPSIPLDLASNDGRLIYAANPFNSKLYVFKRK